MAHKQLTDIKKVFQQNLLRLRKINGYTQEQMADYMGVSREAYSTWERGDREPTFETIAGLAKIFGVRPDELFAYGAGAEREMSQGATIDAVLMVMNRKLAKAGLELRLRNT
jgi:transcriptional regulator with XRE-family HTH domain